MTTIAETNGSAIPSQSVTLFPRHADELEDGSGLTPETIRESGIYSCGDRGKLAGLLNRKSVPRTWGPCLVIPFHDEAGNTLLSRVKPDHPPKQKNGSIRKYLQPTGVPTRLYVPKRVFAILDDPTARLLITEGEKKTLAATQAGFACVGLPGVDNWAPRNKTTLIPDLARIAWKGRDVFIAFDSDAADNEQVEQSQRLLAVVLASHGAKVRIIRIPPAENGDKQGIDDFIVAHDASAFNELVKNAQEPEPPDEDEFKGNASEADPAVEAEYILELSKKRGVVSLQFWRGNAWRWSRGCWRELPSEELRGVVCNAMNDRWLGVKSRHISDVVEQLRAKAMLSASTEPPTWIGEPFAPEFIASECFATKNEVVHLPSLIERREIYSAPASPSFFTTTACEFDLDLEAPQPPTWLRFLDALWGDDQQSIESLQEWFGYLLTADTRQQKMVMIVGPKRSGKGTIARVLRALVGFGNVAAPTLGSLTSNFGLQPLVGKSIAIISDARLSGRTDQAVVVERLLSITGEDAQTIDRKHQSAITCKLPTRFVILTNELPRLNDASGAVVSRVILLMTTKSFLGNEDHELTGKLLEELPGILLWAVGGLHRMRQRGRFVQPDSGLEALGEMNDLSSPVAAFVRDCCFVGPDEAVPVSELFAAWERWCKSQGRERYVGTVQSFGRDLLAVVPTVRRARPRDSGSRVRVYRGVGLGGTANSGEGF